MQEALPNSGDGRNNPWLDLVRSLAILLVLFRHGERAFNVASDGQPGPLGTIFINGWIGVDLFFVLSGYLIARHLIRRGVGSGELQIGTYLAMRALRIVPAYLAVLALIVAGVFWHYEVSQDELPLRIAYHVLFLQDYLPSNINVVFWSLGVEEKFYLLAPLLIFALLRCRTVLHQAILLFALFSLSFVLKASLFQRLPGGIEYDQFFLLFRSPFHMALEGLIVGVGIAIAEHAGLVRTSRKAGLIVLSLSTSALLVWLASHDFMAKISAIDVLVQPSIIAILAGLMTLGAVQLAGTPMPWTRPFRGLSRVSYSLYLIHYPLIPMVTAVAAPRGSLVFWSCYLAASFSAAYLLHRGVERPFLLWKDRLGAQERQWKLQEPLSGVPNQSGL